MELLETIVKVKPSDEEVAVHLITIEDDFKAQQQNENLEKIQVPLNFHGTNRP